MAPSGKTTIVFTQIPQPNSESCCVVLPLICRNEREASKYIPMVVEVAPQHHHSSLLLCSISKRWFMKPTYINATWNYSPTHFHRIIYNGVYDE